MRFTTETRGVLEMLNFIPAYMKRRTYAGTILSEPKFLGCMDNQIFTQCDPLRESSAINIHQTMFFIYKSGRQVQSIIAVDKRSPQS